MAILKDNPFMQNASGAVGKTLVYKKYYDKTVVSKMPNMSNRVLSEKQKESNKRMRLATIYAKAWYKIEEEKIRARIRLKLPAHKSLFHAMVKEYLDQHKHLTLDEMNRNLLSELPVKKPAPNSETGTSNTEGATPAPNL